MGARPGVVARLRLFWDDSRSLQAYVVGTAAIAVWLEFALAAIHWRATDVWLRYRRPARLNGMARYFAHISQLGRIRYGDVPGSIGVLEALDKFMPVGEASCRIHVEGGWPCGRSGSASRKSPADG